MEMDTQKKRATFFPPNTESFINNLFISNS